jgi:hypothetical protein
MARLSGRVALLTVRADAQQGRLDDVFHMLTEACQIMGTLPKADSARLQLVEERLNAQDEAWVAYRASRGNVASRPVPGPQLQILRGGKGG